MFLFPRLIVETSTPFVIAIILVTSGTVLICFNRNRIAFMLNAAGLSILVIFGYGLFVESYHKQKESIYAPMILNEKEHEKFKTINHIVVLGSGHVSDSRLPVSSQIGHASLYRIVEGKRLASLLPHAQIVICGGVGYDPIPNAHVVAEVASIIGISSQRIIIEDRPRDTEQEASYLSPLLGTEPFLLVTSAGHMVRAMEIFKSRGLNPVAAPTHFRYKEGLGRNASSYLPNPENLVLAKQMVYEQLGMIWIKLKTLWIKNQL